VREDRADHQGVMSLKATLKRLLERGDLGAQPAFGQVGEHLRIGRAGANASSIALADLPRMSDVKDDENSPVATMGIPHLVGGL
jgi:hypothetical protein